MNNSSNYCLQHDQYFDNTWCPRCTHIRTIEPEVILQISDTTNYCLHHERYFRTSICPECERGDMHYQEPQLQVENDSQPAQQLQTENRRSQERRMAVKCSVSSIGWNPAYADALNDLVIKVNELTLHTYMFARFLFVRELSDDPSFDIQKFVTKEFFVEVFLSLTTGTRNGAGASAQTLEYRQLIISGISYYKIVSGCRQIELVYAYQIALYQANTIVTGYLNSIMNGFGQQLRRIINSLLNVKVKAAQRRSELREQGHSQAYIKSRVEEEMYAPARRFKLATGQRRVNASSIPNSMQDAFLALEPVITAYPDSYNFSRNSIYYDSQAHPDKHILAYYKMSQVCETLNIKSFQCFPLRNSFVPGYFQIDTRILRRNILRENDDDYSLDGKLRSWEKVVDLQSKAFKAQGADHQLTFRGSIQTDGVGVSVLKTTSDTRAGGPRRQTVRANINEPNITDLSLEDLRATVGRCVLVDPNRRDLLFCMHEDSTPEQKQILRYTKNTQAKQRKQRKYRSIQQSVKDQDRNIALAEARLSRFSRSSTSPVVFARYIIQRSNVATVLHQHYSYTTTFPRGNTPRVPLHRKLRLSSIINRNREDDLLVSDLRRSFGDNSVLIMGNWSSGNNAFHEPIRGIGMRRAL